MGGVLITSLAVPKHRVNCCDLSVVMKFNNDDATIDLDPVDDDVEAADDNDEQQEEMNWAEQVAVEQWQNKHEKKTQKRKQSALQKFQSVTVASALDGGITKLWAPLQGDDRASLIGHSDNVVSIASSNTNAITCSLDGTVKSWNLQSASATSSVKTQLNNYRHCHSGEVSFLSSFKHVGIDFVVSGCAAGEVKIWRLAEEQLVFLTSLEDHQSRIVSVVKLSDDDDDSFVSLATFSTGGMIITWKITIVQSQYDEKAMSLAVKKMNVQSCGFGITSVEGAANHKEKRYSVDFLNGKSLAVVFHPESLCITIHKESRDDESEADFKYTHLNTWIGLIFDGIRKNDSDVVTASAQLGSQTLIGDNTGRLYETNGNSAQIHDGRITGIDICNYDKYASSGDDVIVTCSTDRSIKLWMKTSKNPSALQQIGHYFGFSAFTAMKVVNDDVLLCGDVRGYVYRIRMKKSGLQVKDAPVRMELLYRL